MDIKTNDYYNSFETKIKPVIPVREEYNLSETDIPAVPEGTIKYELNLIEFPIFSKNDKIKECVSMTYVFSETDNTFVSIIPGSDPNAISRKILQEFDEQIFYGLLRLYEETNNRTIISDYPTIMKISGIDYIGKNVIRTKDSLQRMRKCEIIFNKVFYDAYAKSQGFEFINRTKSLNLISKLETLTFEKYSEMNEKEQSNYKKHFDKHRNIKEIVILTLNEDIVNNIENKSHKYFKIEDILDIKNPTARKLFIMLTKWKYWEKTNKIRRTSKFLASRIPLSWKQKNLSSTINSLENACEYLKSQGKINYVLDKSQGIAKSIIEFELISTELALPNSKIGTEETGQESLEITIVNEKNETVTNKLDNVDEQVEELLAILPTGEPKMLWQKKLQKALQEHSFEMVKADLEYCKSQNPKALLSYFETSLTKGHYSAYSEDKKKEREEERKMMQQLQEEQDKIESEKNEKIDRIVEMKYNALTDEDKSFYMEKYASQNEIIKKAVNFELFVKDRIKQMYL